MAEPNTPQMAKKMPSAPVVIEEKLTFKHLGYKPKIQKRGHSYFLTINKLIVVGNELEAKQELYAYLGENSLGRGILVIYLDGRAKGIC